jgi:hypothetical protein
MNSAAIYDYFLQALQMFDASSTQLDINELEEIVRLIDTAYNAKDNEYRKQQDALLEQKKRSKDWKKYIFLLFQIIYFSENLSRDTLLRIIHDNSQFIYKKANFSGIQTEELIYLCAANVCCLVNRNFPIKLKNELVGSLERLFKIEDEHKGKKHNNDLNDSDNTTSNRKICCIAISGGTQLESL